MQLVRLHHEMAAKMIALLEHSQGQRYTHYALLTTRYLLLTTCYLLLTACCLQLRPLVAGASRRVPTHY